MTSHTWLVLALLALLSGPLLYRLARSRGVALASLDGFSCTAIAGLVLLHGMPEAFSLAGWWAPLAALVGLIAPTMFERWRKRLAPRAHAAALALALVGLGTHAFADGSALASSNNALALAVVLHRLPVSLAIWMLLLGHFRFFLRSTALVALGLATCAGFFTGAALLADQLWVGLLQGLVSGSLLHVVFHRPALAAAVPPRRRAWARASAALGALSGAALVTAAHLLDVPHAPEAAHGPDAAHALLSLALQSAPALLLAYIGAGLLDAFMPRGTVRWMQRGTAFSRALRGVGFGLPLPVCSCGVLPLYRSLVLRGTPAAAALAFLVATPEIGIDAALLSLPLLGLELTLLRITSAALVAISVGWAVGRLAHDVTVKNEDELNGEPLNQSPLSRRLLGAARSGLGEVVDNTAPWILLGLGIAAIGAQSFDPLWLAKLPTGASIGLFALAGIPTYVCATGATPLVTMFIAKGVSPGAALAFLLTGPATNATTFGVVSQLHGRRLAIAFGLAVSGLAVALGFATNAILPHPKVFPLAAGQHVDHAGAFRWFCLAALALVYVASFVRQGPRAFLARIYNLNEVDGQSSDSCHTATNGDEEHATHGCCGAS